MKPSKITVIAFLLFTFVGITQVSANSVSCYHCNIFVGSGSKSPSSHPSPQEDGGSDPDLQQCVVQESEDLRPGDRPTEECGRMAGTRCFPCRNGILWCNIDRTGRFADCCHRHHAFSNHGSRKTQGQCQG